MSADYQSPILASHHPKRRLQVDVKSDGNADELVTHFENGNICRAAAKGNPYRLSIALFITYSDQP